MINCRFVVLESNLMEFTADKYEIYQMREEFSVDDFLEESYFSRIRCYVPPLKKMHVASKLWQSKTTATGSLVCPMIVDMYQFMEQKDNDGSQTAAFKAALRRSIQKRLLVRWFCPAEGEGGEAKEGWI